MTNQLTASGAISHVDATEQMDPAVEREEVDVVPSKLEAAHTHTESTEVPLKGSLQQSTDYPSSEQIVGDAAAVPTTSDDYMGKTIISLRMTKRTKRSLE